MTRAPHPLPPVGFPSPSRAMARSYGLELDLAPRYWMRPAVGLGFFVFAFVVVTASAGLAASLCALGSAQMLVPLFDLCRTPRRVDTEGVTMRSFSRRHMWRDLRSVCRAEKRGRDALMAFRVELVFTTGRAVLDSRLLPRAGEAADFIGRLLGRPLGPS